MTEAVATVGSEAEPFTATVLNPVVSSNVPPQDLTSIRVRLSFEKSRDEPSSKYTRTDIDTAVGTKNGFAEAPSPCFVIRGAEAVATILVAAGRVTVTTPSPLATTSPQTNHEARSTGPDMLVAPTYRSRQNAHG